MRIDGSHIDQIARHIAVEMKEAITLPAGNPFAGIAIYVGSIPFVQGPSRVEELKAIARLIAAAPELLEALRSLTNEATGFLACADLPTHGITNMRVLKAKIDASRAAIAKTTGEKS